MEKPTKCVPCSSDLPPLERGKCEEYLAGLPGWELEDDARAIVRKFQFQEFCSGYGICGESRQSG